jgi:hypothetical protein
LVSFPPAASPYIDSTGPKCGFGQSGPIWYLFAQGGDIGTPVKAVCTIPTETRVLVPVLPAFCIPDPDQTIHDSQRDCADGFDRPNFLLLQIDGGDYTNLIERRTARPFPLSVPEKNIFAPDLPGGIFTAVSDGFFATLAPLAAGDHTLRVQVSITTFDGEVLAYDTEYLLHIVEPATTLPVDPEARALGRGTQRRGVRR